jgi:hypothetical protein
MEKSRCVWLYVTFCWLLLGASTAAQAQENEEQKNRWSVGVKGGITLPSVISSNQSLLRTGFRTQSRIRYTGGVAVQYLTEKNFGLQVEFNYTQRGWEERPPLGLEGRLPTRFYRVNLDYAEVPVLAHGYFGKRNLRLFLNAGVYLAYLLSAETERASIPDDEDITIFYEAQFQNRIDFGVRGGGGVEVVTRVGMFQAEGSYNFGLNSVMDKNVQQIPHIVQNSTVAITLGYYVQF